VTGRGPVKKSLLSTASWKKRQLPSEISHHSWSWPADTVDIISEKGKIIEQVSGESLHSLDVLSPSPALKQVVEREKKHAESLFVLHILC